VNFTSIYKELSIINYKLEAFAKGIIFCIEKEFILCDYKPDLLEIPKRAKGIYFFEIKKNDTSLAFNDWITAFKEEWEKNEIRNRPKSRKISIEKLSGFTDDWIPFYIGKSKNIQHRVNQHISLGETSTYALKLKAMKNLDDKTFRLSYIIIDTEHYDMVMPKIEQVLREKYNPIIGKQ
jgi:hypothetical protein